MTNGRIDRQQVIQKNSLAWVSNSGELNTIHRSPPRRKEEIQNKSIQQCNDKAIPFKCSETVGMDGSNFKAAVISLPVTEQAGQKPR